ncbi:MAG: TolC family protein [Terriglobia bacterium]
MEHRRLRFIAQTGILLLAIAASAWASQKATKNSAEPAEATLYNYTHSSSFPHVLSTYTPPFVPQAKLKNSSLLDDLISGGKLNLSLEDSIALALENNLDIAVARYNLPLAQTNLLRTRAGGAARTVAGANLSSALFSGALGAGVSGGGGSGGGNAGGSLGGGVPSVGSTSCCDPYLDILYGWGYTVTPLNYPTTSGVPIFDAHSDYVYASYSQGFLTGTSVSLSVIGTRGTSNATTDLFNPDITSGYTFGITQSFLNGFGRRANEKFIRIAQNELQYSDSVFRQKVIETAAKVMSNYYDLLADLEDIHVAEEGAAYSRKLLEDNQEEQKIGAAAQFDVAQAQLDLANREEALLTARNTFEQDSQSMKALISKSFSGEIAAVAIAPTDQLPEPHPGDIPPMAEALREGLKDRPEIEQAEVNLKDQHITIQADRNALLPSLNAFAAFSPQGQGGALGGAFGPLLRNHYPGYGYGVRLSIPIRNREAQADAASALLEERQMQMQLQQARNQVVWDVSKAVALVHQAQGQLGAAVRVSGLARQNYDMLHTKFTMGQATVSEVITSQSQLATAEASEVTARAGYAKALVAYEQATGTILARNHIELSDAVRGEVPRRPNIPGAPVVVHQ